MERFKSVLMLVLLLVGLILIGQPGLMQASGGDYSKVTIKLAFQYGMQYAPAYIVKELQLLEEQLPGVKLEWGNFGGGSAMNEALISGRLDVGFIGVPPTLIALDKGADYKIAAGICVIPGDLMVHPSSGIKSLHDIKPEHKISMPSIGCTQHIMLSMISDNLFGDANRFDDNLVAMANPDAYIALISGTDIVAHFAGMPYIALELKEGMKSILTVDENTGGISIICVATKKFAAKQDLYAALINSLEQAIELINAKDERALQIISDYEQITTNTAQEYIDWPGTIYTTDLHKVSAVARFMKQAGYLNNEYQGFENISWPGAIEATE